MSETPISIFSRPSLSALMKGWTALFASFVLCLAAQIPALSKIQTPENPLIGAYMSSGAVTGVLICTLALLLSLPPVAHLAGSAHTMMGRYVKTPSLWALFLSAALGAVAGILAMTTGQDIGGAFFASSFLVLVVMIVPVLMTSVSYWFLLVRPAAGHEGGALAVTIYSTLLILWNVYCYIVTSALIHPPAP